MIFLLSTSVPAIAAPDAWVTSDRLNRRTCPDVECGKVGHFMFREGTQVFETRNGWSRVSNYYTASCIKGISEFVEAGNKVCDESNGIVNGEFAEWVATQHLSDVRPANPAEGAVGDYSLVKGSDDYRLYKDAFAKAASSLIASGRCTKKDFIEMGGWAKSSSKSGPIYFTYCGGMHLSRRLYLNTETGKYYK